MVSNVAFHPASSKQEETKHGAVLLVFYHLAPLTGRTRRYMRGEWLANQQGLITYDNITDVLMDLLWFQCKESIFDLHTRAYISIPGNLPLN
jgi:hypothetical protein